ncbi:alpha/beta hydrolase fold domain-containing protein [Candidatus Clostridium helianthi]|uniref:Alpha/beta hydrolase fold domain-containing protein n=1 Tax=Candidatus Clostridium helianthi TaxID=3381660 RepID=A0ABW8SCD6_9CLOT
MKVKKLQPGYEILGNLPTDMNEVNKIIEPFKHCDVPDDIEIYDKKVPALARDLSDLPPTFVVTLEYDPLRTEGMEYARRLMEFSVPTELYSLPRVCHGFDMVPAPLTLWIREGMYNSLRREFNII